MSESANLDLSPDQKFVAVIEDFISQDAVQTLKEGLLARKEVDSTRHGYEFLGIGDEQSVFNQPYDLEWDPEGIIKSTAFFAKNFYKNMYDLGDQLVLDRIFGNIMNPGALLHQHRDLSYNDNSSNKLDKKVFACGLFLSDDYDGGEFGFFEDQKLSFRPKSGSLVLFNGHSTWHAVGEIISNSRINILYMFYYTDTDNQQ